MNKNLMPKSQDFPGKGQFLVYEAEDGRVKIDVRLEDETIWLTQQLMADLFQTTKQNISLHTNNIFEEGELAPAATVKEFLTVRREGNRMPFSRSMNGRYSPMPERFHTRWQRNRPRPNTTNSTRSAFGKRTCWRVISTKPSSS